MANERDSRIPVMPDDVVADPTAAPVLSVWALEPDTGNRLIMSVSPIWEDPGTWGIALMDCARQIARAYHHKEGISEDRVLDRIFELFDEEREEHTSAIRDAGQIKSH